MVTEKPSEARGPWSNASKCFSFLKKRVVEKNLKFFGVSTLRENLN